MKKSREEVIRELAQEHTVTLSTVATLLHGLQATGGNQVQFNISELGGMGQWQPNLVMVGDMFNHELKSKVDQLCTTLSKLSRELPREVADTTGTLLGHTQATFKGSQNDFEYAYYANTNKLVIYHEGKNTSYDTTGYPLTGVQQAQDNTSKTLSFTHRDGVIAVKDLPEIKS